MALTFRLNISCDNPTFENRHGDITPHTARTETARILRAIADRIEGIDTHGDYTDRNHGWSQHYQTILDYNGNDVGRYAFKTSEQE